MASCQDDGKTCNGDTFLRLIDTVTGTEVASNDDNCGFCSSITHEFSSITTCQSYSLHQGCYSDGSCSGEVQISRLSSDEYALLKITADKAAAPVLMKK
jgi:hypothetical protein